ncbi:hypothetical protein Tco_0198246 [Tanacetum coccineum]
MVLTWWQWRDEGGSDEVGVAMVMRGERATRDEVMCVDGDDNAVGDDGDGHEGGVMVAAVGRQPEEVEARGGEWIWGSGRSGHGDNIWFRPECSPENFSGGGGMVAGGGGRREGWPDIWGRWRRERGL